MRKNLPAVAVICVAMLYATVTAQAEDTTGSLAAESAAAGTDTTGIDATGVDTASGNNRQARAAMRAAARARLARLTGERRYDEATAAAQQVLRLTRQDFGREAPDVIDPLLALADVQWRDGQTKPAEQNLLAGIALIRRHAGPLSADLIEPLTILGRLHLQTGRYDEAAETFDRALRLNHVNLGFTNSDQLPIMDGLTESYVSLDNIEEATFFQTAQLEIQQRRLGIDNPETAPAYHKLARWYRRVMMYEDSVLMYQRADRLIRETLGDASPARIDGLKGLALVYEEAGNPSMATSTLRKALRLVEAVSEPDPLQRAAVLVALGDSLIRAGRFPAADKQYIAAWQSLPDDETGTAQRADYFDKPVRRAGSLFPRYARDARRRPPDRLRTGKILIDYVVDARGHVTDARVVESDPPGLMDRAFLSVYRRSLFRPRYIDGQARASERQFAAHEFRYAIEATATTDNDDERENNTGKLSYPDDDPR